MAEPTFQGIPVASWLFDGRCMRLTQDFSFVDSTGRIWTAPTGSVVDGASIPRVFWRVIGGPFSGRYRPASIIHDVYCQNKKEASAQVHLMFYEAMLCAKVPKWKAWLMYQAVRFFGPKW